MTRAAIVIAGLLAASPADADALIAGDPPPPPPPAARPPTPPVLATPEPAVG